MDELGQATGPMEKELQEFLAQEQQKMQFQAQVRLRLSSVAVLITCCMNVSRIE